MNGAFGVPDINCQGWDYSSIYTRPCSMKEFPQIYMIMEYYHGISWVFDKHNDSKYYREYNTALEQNLST